MSVCVYVFKSFRAFVTIVHYLLSCISIKSRRFTVLLLMKTQTIAFLQIYLNSKLCADAQTHLCICKYVIFSLYLSMCECARAYLCEGMCRCELLLQSPVLKSLADRMHQSSPLSVFHRPSPRPGNNIHQRSLPGQCLSLPVLPHFYCMSLHDASSLSPLHCFFSCFSFLYPSFLVASNCCVSVTCFAKAKSCKRFATSYPIWSVKFGNDWVPSVES